MAGSLLALDVDAHLRVCAYLDPVSLAKLCCTCKAWRAIVSQDQHWENLTNDRWRFLNWPAEQDRATPDSTATSVKNGSASRQHTYQKLYASNNAWDSRKLVSLHHTLSDPVYDVYVQKSDANTSSQTLCILGRQYLHTWEVSTDKSTLSAFELPDEFEAVTEISTGLLAAGGMGTVVVMSAPTESASESVKQPMTVRSSWRSSVHCGDVTDLQYCCKQQRLYAFHPYNLAPSPGSCIQCWDAVTGQITATMTEFLEHYKLACFCIPDQNNATHQLVAGSVTGWCTECHCNAWLATLCCHKSTAALAALCIFDTRAATQMVQRFSMHHRSLYPRMTCAREHYIFTSHIGSPLAVWDQRQMSHTVYEEGNLGNFPRPSALSAENAPMLPPPTRAACHQGLYLDTDGDGLIGRAENGMTWLWDLSSCLGWQRNGPCGTWQYTQDQLAAAASDDHMAHLKPEDAGFCSPPWPRMLGAMPFDAESACPLPKIYLQNGNPFPITYVSPFPIEQHDQARVSCCRPCAHGE